MLGRRATRSPDSQIIGLLDVGTSKMTCAIAVRGSKPGDTRLIGFGLHRSRGVKAGVITDLSEAEQSVRAAVGAAEQQAGVMLNSVVASFSCGRLKSRHFTANAELHGSAVTDEDVERLLAGGRSYAAQHDRRLVHLNRLQLRLDGVCDCANPVGMTGQTLSADLHAVTADDGPIRNLVAVIERCYLVVDGLVASPFASGLACTTAEERRFGVICIDIGGGTSTISAFADGQFIFADAVPAGGNHVTYDLARALRTPLAEAERIKALYGAVIAAPSDLHEVFSYPQAIAEEGMLQSTRGHVRDVIQPRVAALLALAAERIERGGLKSLAGDRIVLTGGCSQLPGLDDFAGSILGCSARIGHPAATLGLSPEAQTPAFSTIAGLLSWPFEGLFDTYETAGHYATGPGYLRRMGQWLKTGF